MISFEFTPPIIPDKELPLNSHAYTLSDSDGDTLEIYDNETEGQDGVVIGVNDEQVIVLEKDISVVFRQILKYAKPEKGSFLAGLQVQLDAEKERQLEEQEKVNVFAKELTGKSLQELSEDAKVLVARLHNRIRGYEIQDKVTGEPDWDETIHETKEAAIESLVDNQHWDFSAREDHPQYWGKKYRIVTIFQ